MSWSCRYCQVSTMKIGDYYMLRDDIWKQVNLDKLGRPVVGGMLCITCVEKKLCRKLTRDDFSDALINHLDNSWAHSMNCPFRTSNGKCNCRSIKLKRRLGYA